MPAALCLLFLSLSPQLWNWQTPQQSTLEPEAIREWSSRLTDAALKAYQRPVQTTPKLQAYEQLFLEMKFEELEPLLLSLENELKATAPYQGIASDFQKIYELKVLLEHALGSKTETKTKAQLQYFLKDKAFKERIPPQFAELYPKRESNWLRNQTSRTLIYGEQIDSVELPIGEYLISVIRFPKIQNGILYITNSDEKFVPIVEQNLISIDDELKLLKQTRPKQSLDLNVQIITSSKTTHLLPQQRLSQIPRTETKKISSESPSLDFYDTSDLDSVSEKHWIRSPWLWVPLGILASAGGGYLIYEYSRGTRKVHTP